MMKQLQRKYIQPFMVASTNQYYQKMVMRYGISHMYSFTANMENQRPLILVPDSCVDIIFDYSDNKVSAKVCGTVLQYTYFPIEFNHTIFGIRFLPGVLPLILDVSMHDLIQNQIQLCETVKDKTICDQVFYNTGFDNQSNVFINHYRDYLRNCDNDCKREGKLRLSASIKNMIEQSDGQLKITKLEEKTGYSTRYIRKVFEEIFGVSPKTFCKIVQFQKAINEMNHNFSRSLTDLSEDLGYYDQSQFIHDFKLYTNLSPGKYSKMIFDMDYAQRIITK